MELEAVMLNVNRDHNQELMEACRDLKEFLEKNRAEVKKVSIYEYDREEHIRMEKQESWEDGVREGILRGEEKQLCKMITKKLKKGKTISQIAEELEEEEEKIQELIAAHDLDSI